MGDKTTVRINFTDWYESFKKNDNSLINALKKYFNVELSETPDFLSFVNMTAPVSGSPLPASRTWPEITAFLFCASRLAKGSKVSKTKAANMHDLLILLIFFWSRSYEGGNAIRLHSHG